MLPRLSIVPFSGFTEFTPVVPALYWNVYSAEQRLKALCERIGKSEQYMDYVADTINDYSKDVADEVNRELEEAHRELENLREELIKLILETGEGSLDWDCQYGIYTSSVQAMRDMFNDVTVHSMTIAEFNVYEMTVDELADSGVNVAGWAVMNRWIVDNDEPIYPEYQYSD